MKNVLLILALATLWWVGGWIAGAGLSAFFDVAWAIQCASLNVVAGWLCCYGSHVTKTLSASFMKGLKIASQVYQRSPFCGCCLCR